MLLEVLLGSSDHLERNKLEATLFEASDDFANESCLNYQQIQKWVVDRRTTLDAVRPFQSSVNAGRALYAANVLDHNAVRELLVSYTCSKQSRPLTKTVLVWQTCLQLVSKKQERERKIIASGLVSHGPIGKV